MENVDKTLFLDRVSLSLLQEKLIAEAVSRGEICYHPFNRQNILFNSTTGEKIELNCKSWRCPKHQNSWLFRWQAVVCRELEVNPVDKLITLTTKSANMLPEQLSLVRQLFWRDVRKEVKQSFEYLSVLEFTTKTRLPHLHILARGKYIHQKKVSAIWAKSLRAAGLYSATVVKIERPRSQGKVARYALKYALSGAEKGQAIPDTWRGRKITYSKGFFQAASPTQHWQAWRVEKFGKSAISGQFNLIADNPFLKADNPLERLSSVYFGSLDGQDFFDCDE